MAANLPLGPVLLGLAGYELDAEERELLRHPAVGGVVLFSRNYAEPAQLRALCAAIRALRRPRLLIATDHEGGRVQRFRDGFTRLPAAARLGAAYAQDAEHGLTLARTLGRVLAEELTTIGVDLAFAPVVDLDYGASAIIGDRALHADPAAVGDLAAAMLRGMAEAGMAATAKHFPGHGAIVPDSHLELPVDPRPLAALRAADLLPYRRLMAEGLSSVMTAHVVYPALDALPASFSARWIEQELRGELGFRGAVISDDLDMKACVGLGDHAARAAAALAAGCDIVLACNERAGAVQILDAGVAREAGSDAAAAAARRAALLAAPATAAPVAEADRRRLATLQDDD